MKFPRRGWRAALPVFGPLLLVLGGTAVLLQLGILGAGPSPSPTSSPAPTRTAAPTPFDVTHIVSGTDTYGITYEAGNVIVRRSTATGIDILVQTAADPAPFASPPTANGIAAYSVACPGSGQAAETEFIYGYAIGTPGSGEYVYAGPPADGGVGDAGLFLFVLRSASDDGQKATVSRRASGGSEDVSVLSASFHVGPVGSAGVVALPSGCRQR